MNVETLLEASLKEGIRKFLEENRREFDGRIHVSHVTQCLRRSYLEIISPPELQPNFNLFVGAGMHVLIEEILAKELSSYVGMVENVYHEFEFEYPIKNGVLIGTADFVIEFPDEVVVVELKTTKYDLPFPKNQFANRMFEKYVEQLTAYVHFAEIVFDKPSTGVLMFVKRQNGRPSFFRIDKNYETFETIVERANALKKALDEKVEPIGEPDCFCKPFVDPKTREEKGGCPFYHDCPYALRRDNCDLDQYLG